MHGRCQVKQDVPIFRGWIFKDIDEALTLFFTSSHESIFHVRFRDLEGLRIEAHGSRVRDKVSANETKRAENRKRMALPYSCYQQKHTTCSTIL
jgi:hypothetical protein